MNRSLRDVLSTHVSPLGAALVDAQLAAGRISLSTTSSTKSSKTNTNTNTTTNTNTITNTNTRSNTIASFEQVDADRRLLAHNVVEVRSHMHELPALVRPGDAAQWPLSVEIVEPTTSGSKGKVGDKRERSAMDIDVHNEVVAVCKPASLVVHPTGRYRHNSLFFALQRAALVEHEHYSPNELPAWFAQPLYAVHRLDRGVSGALLLARTPAAAHSISVQLRQRAARKAYVARCSGGAGLPLFKTMVRLFLSRFAFSRFRMNH